MPTVLVFDGLRVVIYLNDHRPAHVHVIGRGCEAVFRLNCRDAGVELRENYGFSRSEVRRIGLRLDKEKQFLCEKWRELHGDAR